MNTGAGLPAWKYVVCQCSVSFTADGTQPWTQHNFDSGVQPSGCHDGKPTSQPQVHTYDLVGLVVCPCSAVVGARVKGPKVSHTVGSNGDCHGGRDRACGGRHAQAAATTAPAMVRRQHNTGKSNQLEAGAGNACVLAVEASLGPTLVKPQLGLIPRQQDFHQAHPSRTEEEEPLNAVELPGWACQPCLGSPPGEAPAGFTLQGSSSMGGPFYLPCPFGAVALMVTGPGVVPVVQAQEAMPRASVVEEGVSGVQVTAPAGSTAGPGHTEGSTAVQQEAAAVGRHMSVKLGVARE